MPGLVSLASALNAQLAEKLSEVVILELDEQDSPTGRRLKFQYFPETIRDTKAVNWQQKEVPGGSLPIYQWINSGERLISFTASFTSDVDLYSLAPDPYSTLKGAGIVGRNIDIRSAIVWLRRFELPKYGGLTEIGVPLTYAPAKLVLFVPGSGIGIAGGGPSFGGQNSMLCIMTQCDVTYDQFFPNGLPRIATIDLAFAQIAQFGGAVFFPSRETEMEQSLSGNAAGQTLPFGYNLNPNRRSDAVIAEALNIVAR